MEATIRGPRQGIPPQHQEQTKAPERIVNMLVPMWRSLPITPALPPMSSERTEAIRAEVRRYADRIWAEAFHAGAAFGLAWSAQPIRVILGPGQAAETAFEALLSARPREGAGRAS